MVTICFVSSHLTPKIWYRDEYRHWLSITIFILTTMSLMRLSMAVLVSHNWVHYAEGRYFGCSYDKRRGDIFKHDRTKKIKFIGNSCIEISINQLWTKIWNKNWQILSTVFQPILTLKGSYTLAKFLENQLMTTTVALLVLAVMVNATHIGFILYVLGFLMWSR